MIYTHYIAPTLKIIVNTVDRFAFDIWRMHTREEAKLIHWSSILS